MVGDCAVIIQKVADEVSIMALFFIACFCLYSHMDGDQLNSTRAVCCTHTLLFSASTVVRDEQCGHHVRHALAMCVAQFRKLICTSA